MTLLYANRDDRSVIFSDALRELAAKYPDRLTVVHWLESLQGLPSATALAQAGRPATPTGPAFICGPGPFMEAARVALELAESACAASTYRGVQVAGHRSVRGGDDRGHVTTSRPPPRWCELDGETHTVSWPRKAKLLDVLLAKGLDAPFSCREGHCGACACTLRSGRVSMEVNDVLEQQDLDDGLILACQSHPESDSVEVTYDE